MFDFGAFLDTITEQMDTFLSADFDDVSADAEDGYANLIYEYKLCADDNEYLEY